MKFSELNLSIRDEIKTVKIGDNVIEVKQYLPLEKKIDIISLAIKEYLCFHSKKRLNGRFRL